jgi:hypothetical protein
MITGVAACIKKVRVNILNRQGNGGIAIFYQDFRGEGFMDDDGRGGGREDEEGEDRK